MSDALSNLFREIARQWKPPPKWKVSQWADSTRKLSSEASAEPGQWDTARAEYQREIMDAINDPATERVVIMSSAQIGKALCIETPIPTPDGWRKMGDLKAGDMVFDETGNACRVTFATPVMHDRSCYRVTFSDGSALIADAEHQWTVENDIGTKSQYRIETKTTAQMLGDYKVGKRNRYAIAVTQPIQCNRARLPIDPYFLGVWLGDGHSYSTGITVGDQDKDEMLALITKCGYQSTVIRDGSCWKVLVDPARNSGDEFCFGLSRDMRKAGLIGKGQSYKHIPSAYLRASYDQRLALLQGLMDTDGSIGSNGRAEFSTTSKTIADGFHELVCSLGFKASMSIKRPRTTYKGQMVFGSIAYRFSFIAYSEQPIFRLKRKLARQPSQEGRRVTETKRRRIVDIQRVESVPVKCIQVDSKSRLYLAGRDFIPTHNTEILNNVVGYYIDYDPCPMLMLQPTLEMGETWSKDRFDPMARDTPEIGQRIAGGKARDKKSTILHKTFTGGHLTVAGSNSPTSLAMRPIRVVLADEVDRYPPSAGNEGDPLNLAIKRTSTFWNRKILAVSTPTLKGFSRIEAAFEETDKRRFHIACPHCQTEHVLAWGNIVWGKDTPACGDPEKALFHCPSCDGYYNDVQKNAAVKRGRWIATAPFKGRAGFHIWEAYSPWRRLSEIVRDFLDAKDDPEKLQVWVNTSLGETWEGSGDALRDSDLMNRLPFKQDEHDVPRLGLLLTAGVDTQPDRLEVEVVAWGSGEQSWSVDYHVIHGDPDIPEGTAGSPWTELMDYLRKRWRHESGAEVTVGWTCIDSGGHNTQAVYTYAKRHKGERVFAIKGRGGAGLPIVGAPSRKRTGKVRRPVDVHIVGVDSAKMTVLNRFKLETPGPGYCHFPVGRDPEWFRQLCAEKLVTKFVKGFPVREFHKVGGVRNEALDCRVYAFAAMVLAAPQWDKLALRMKTRTTTMQIEKQKPQTEPNQKDPQPTAQDDSKAEPQTEPQRPKPKPSPRRRRSSFVTSWRN